MEEWTKEHKVALEEYAINSADLKNAITGLDGAIKVLKVNKASVAFVQLPQEMKDTIQSAATIADALGLASGSKAVSMLQKADPELDLKVKDYEFHAGDIVATLEKLQGEFKTKKGEVDDAEKERNDAYDKNMKDAKDFVKEKEGTLDDKKKDRQDKIAAIATASSDFSGISAQFLDDQKYLQELVEICSDKATTWDGRQKVRADELTALTMAIGIVKGTVAEKTSKATVRLIQQKFASTRAELTARSEDAMEAVEADAEKQEDGGAFPLGFLQRRMTSPHHALDGVGMATRELQRELDHPERLAKDSVAVSKMSDNGRAMVMSLLKQKGMALHSAMLTNLADRIGSGKDVFAKVKKLIQELIERMLQEAANESTQKGWCDKSMSDAKQKRDYTADALQKLNAEMAQLEARRDKLEEALATLATEITALEKAQKDADETRKEEKTENAATVKEAGEGLDAVSQAIEILDRFYKTAANKAEKKAFVQASPADDAPDAGFESGEAYAGAQGEAGGVIGMLEVIKSDFVRTVKKTEEAEAQAEDDHLKFTTETQSSLAEKNTATTIKTTQKDEAKAKLADAQEGMDSKTELLISTIKELKELHATCVDTGMSYKEREAARQDEIDALKKALCIFNAYAEYGAEGASSQC